MSQPTVIPAEYGTLVLEFLGRLDPDGTFTPKGHWTHPVIAWECRWDPESNSTSAAPIFLREADLYASTLDARHSHGTYGDDEGDYIATEDFEVVRPGHELGIYLDRIERTAVGHARDIHLKRTLIERKRRRSANGTDEPPTNIVRTTK